MTATRLLHVRTPFALFEIHGPTLSRWGSIRGTGCRPHLAIESTNGSAEVVWTNRDGEVQFWSVGQHGPAFFEDTRYRLRVKSLIPRITPILVHRDPYLFQEIDTYPDDCMCAGPFNFRRQVGRSLLETRIGQETLSITIEVFPVKLDYFEDYNVLLSEVASAGRGLALEYLRATFRLGTLEESDGVTNLEWLTLVRNEIKSIERAIAYIDEHPHSSLSYAIKDVRADRIKRVDSSVRRAIIRNQGSGPWLNVPGIGQIHDTLPSVRSQETSDTPENRWVRLNLNIILDHLKDIHASIADEISRNRRSHRRIGKRLLSEEQEVAKLVSTIKHLLSLSVLSSAPGMPPPEFVSLALLSKPGYSEAYQAITVLRLGLNVSTANFDLSVMDVHSLYETWCFIQILQYVVELTLGEIKLGGLVHFEESGLRIRLRHGEQSTITYAGPQGPQGVTILYNPEYPGLTGNQRPDIVLRFQHQGWPDLVVVFDAKYRLDASDEYRSRFGTAGPPQDAINALHRYRDAIVVDSVERGINRPVVKGIALFPLGTDQSINFMSSQLYKALESLGIGALPFLPSNTGLTKEWLSSLVSLPPERLADPGPPFGALSEKQRRALLAATVKPAGYA